MSGQPLRGKPQFKDYCLILQVHPEADAAMIDAAYWHLAKRYNEAALHDSVAHEKIEELNEAYNVLGSADRRDAYMLEREAVLGVDALPEPPPPLAQQPPLSIMARQKPRPRKQVSQLLEGRKPPQGAMASFLALTIILGLAAASFLAGASPFALAAVLAGGAAIAALPLIRLLRPRLHIARQPREEEGAPFIPIDTARLKSATDSRAEKLRSHAAPPSASASPNGTEPGPTEATAIEDPRD